MGKRAAKKQQAPKKKEVLAVVFPCLFCNHEKSVSVKIDRKVGVGSLNCKVCGQSFQCAVNYLSAAVDVYSEWVDACDAVAKTEGAEGGATPPRRFERAPATTGSKAQDEELVLDDDDIEVGGGYGREDDGLINDDEDDY